MPIRIFSLLNTSISTKMISLVFKNNLYLIFNNQYIYIHGSCRGQAILHLPAIVYILLTFI